MSAPNGDNSTLSRLRLRDYFAQRPVLPEELPGVMRKHIFTGAMGTLYYYLVTDLFFVYFGTEIGMSRAQWGLLWGVVSFAVAAQLLSAFITRRMGNRKMVWFGAMFAGRVLRLVGILAALWLWRNGRPGAGVVLIIGVCLSEFLINMSAPPWLSWLADIIPASEHGAFWGRRSAKMALAVMGVMIPCAIVVDSLTEAHKLTAVVLIFTAATILGLIDILIHGTIPEPAMSKPPEKHFLVELLEPFRDRSFRPWLVFNVSWSFGMMFGAAFGMVYFVQELGIKDHLLGGVLALTGLGLLGRFIAGAWAGRLVDRFGPKRVLFWGYLFWGTLPLSWILATPKTALPLLGAASLMAGVACSAADSAANKLITRIPLPECRATYVSVSSSLGSLAGGCGAVVAGIGMKAIGEWHVDLLGRFVGAYIVIFAISLLLRQGSVFLLVRRIRNPNA